MSKKAIANWIALSDYDLETAEAMFKTKRYLYVAFTCQQSVEKLLKAYFLKLKKQTPPYIHNLLLLLEKTKLKSQIEKSELDLLQLLNSYYIESRYTEELKELFSTLTPKRVKEVLRETKSLTKKLKKLINDLEEKRNGK